MVTIATTSRSQRRLSGSRDFIVELGARPALVTIAALLIATTGCSSHQVLAGADPNPKTGCQSGRGPDGGTTTTVPGPTTDIAEPTVLPDQTLPPVTIPADPAIPEPPQAMILPPPRTALSIEPNDGYDRVIFELTGSCPSWRTQYVGEAITYGHSDVVAVNGESILEVVVYGCGFGPDRVSNDDAKVVTEIRRPRCSNVDPLAEIPTTQLFIGVDRDRPPFKVSVLKDPPRLAVDIAH